MPGTCQRNDCMPWGRNLHELDEQPSSVSAKQSCQHCGNVKSHRSRCAVTCAKSWATRTSRRENDHIVECRTSRAQRVKL
jgi:hypothetical protein